VSPPQAISGAAPDGSPVTVDLSTGRVVVWLLTSSCAPCRPVWARLGPGDVAVTPGPATESRRKVGSLATGGVTVVMSSEAWFALEPGPAPWRVVLQDGVVVESGSGEAGA
jgi:hypothetical protein